MKSSEADKVTWTPVRLTGVQGAADHELGRMWWCWWCFVQSGRCRHTSQYLKCQGILEFVSLLLVASSVIFSEPPTQRKTMYLFGC